MRSIPNRILRLPVFIAAMALAALPAFAINEGHFERTLKVNGTANVQIETGSGSIDVRTGSSNEILITGHIRASEWFGGNSEEKIKRLESTPPIEQSGKDVLSGPIDEPALKRNSSISSEADVPSSTQLAALYA